jgi:DNA-damage-inducible protein D
MKILPAEFDGQSIRRVYDEAAEVWWFSVVDVVQVLTQQADYQTARKYWNKLKERLSKEGSESVTTCHRRKLPAADGKNYLTDVASAETLLRLVQSVPSPKAEPIKLWLSKVGYERMQELADPALSLNRARATWQQHGRSDKWIQQRMTGQETRNKLTDQPQPARPHERGRTDLYRLGRAVYPPNSRNHRGYGHAGNAVAAKEGGGIAKQARKQLESKTGKPVVTGGNYLPLKKPDV